MNKENIFDELDKDLELNSADLQMKLFQVPLLYRKWQRIYFKYKKQLNKKVKELDALYKRKYYEIKDGDRLLDNAKEINFNIIADNEYSKLRLETETLKDMVEILEDTVKRISRMSFDIKNLIEWQQFLNGGR